MFKNIYHLKFYLMLLGKVRTDPFNLVTYSPIEYSEMGLDTENRVFDKVFF